MPDFLERLKARANDPFDARRAYLLRDAAENQEPTLAVVNMAGVQAGADPKSMSVPVLISTTLQDRYGDVILSDGCDTAEYTANPVVLLNHCSYGSAGLPIGKAKDPLGELQIKVEERQVTGRTFFAQSYELAVQVFHLCYEGVMPGVSVGFNPIRSEIEEMYSDDKPPRFLGMLFKKWKLLEYSHVTIPANPECVTLALQRKIDGRPMLAELVRALSPFAAPQLPWANGWTPTEDATVTKALTPPLTPPAPVQAPAPAPTPAPAVTAAVPVPVTKADEPKPDDKPPEKKDPDKPADEEVKDDELLPGAKLLKGYHAKLDALVDHLEKGLSKQENEAVTKHVVERMGVHCAQRDETMETMKSAYPDLEFDDEPDDDDKPKDDDKPNEKKAPLRVRRLSPGSAAAVLQRSAVLDEMARAENLNHQQRALLLDTAAGLRAAAADADDELDPDTAKILLPAIQELGKQLKRTRQTVLAATGRR